MALRAGVGEGLEPTGECLHLQTGRGGGVVRWWAGGLVGWCCVDGVETCGEMKVGKCGQRAGRRGAEVHAEVQRYAHLGVLRLALRRARLELLLETSHLVSGETAAGAGDWGWAREILGTPGLEHSNLSL